MGKRSCVHWCWKCELEQPLWRRSGRRLLKRLKIEISNCIFVSNCAVCLIGKQKEVCCLFEARKTRHSKKSAGHEGTHQSGQTGLWLFLDSYLMASSAFHLCSCASCLERGKRQREIFFLESSEVTLNQESCPLELCKDKMLWKSLFVKICSGSPDIYSSCHHKALA